MAERELELSRRQSTVARIPAAEVWSRRVGFSDTAGCGVSCDQAGRIVWIGLTSQIRPCP